MSLLLRLLAVVCVIWAVLLLEVKDQALPAEQLTPLTRGLADGLGLANLAFAYVFWYAARAPLANRAAVYGGIVLTALRTANDLYNLLVLLPPDQAMVSLADLILSMALLVGILEGLPRLLNPQPTPPDRAGP